MERRRWPKWLLRERRKQNDTDMERRYEPSREEQRRQLFLTHVLRKQKRKMSLTQGELNRIGHFIDKQIEQDRYERG